MVSIHPYPPVMTCANCKQQYGEWWCRKDMCFFCEKFLPMRDTYEDILGKIEWFYLWSGYISRESYYKEYLTNMKKWCKYWSINPSTHDIKKEEELYTIKNSTREYWH